MVALAILLSAMALVPYVALPSQRIEWQLFADAYEPQLGIDSTIGAPGSFFTVTGTNYPANSQVTVIINGFALGTVTSDGSGGFTFQIDTTAAGEGNYVVTATANPSATATVSFVLDSAEPVVGTMDAGLPQIVIPAGIPFTEIIYLPLILNK
jgi:hypothetical protein